MTEVDTDEPKEPEPQKAMVVKRQAMAPSDIATLMGALAAAMPVGAEMPTAIPIVKRLTRGAPSRQVYRQNAPERKQGAREMARRQKQLARTRVREEPA
jgi:hypothetical protein